MLESGLGMIALTVQSWINLATGESVLGSKASILLALAILAASYFVYCHHRRSTFQLHTRRAPRKSVGLGTASNQKDRDLGEWEPVKFVYPAFEPCEKELGDIAPMENRHWKAGPYNATMGLRNMPWDQWIEVDNQYERYHRIRKHRVQTRGEKGIRVLSDAHNPLVKAGYSALTAVELVHEVAEYLIRKYPKTFRVASRHTVATLLRSPSAGEGCRSRFLSTSQEPLDLDEYSDWGWDGEPPIKTIHVEATRETFELPLNVKDGERAPERALEIAALLVQDDLAIMIEGEDGKYYFQAGAILVPGFWRMEDKIGLPLEQIHISGDVPFYREKLQGSMARFFRRLALDKPVVRSNYFLQALPEVEKRGGVDPEELAWGTTSNGPEDEFGGHAHQGESDKRDVPVERVLMRTERQTLRRLGVSGAVVFTIRTYTEAVEGLGEDVARRLGSAMGSWPPEVQHYKGGAWEQVTDRIQQGTNRCKQ